MELSHWRSVWGDRYAAAVPDGRDRIGRHPGVAVMFHSVLDGRLAIRAGMVEGILERQQDVLVEVLDRWGEVPVEINRPADMVLGFIESFRNGIAMQRMIRSEAVFHWASEQFGYDELALGGTSANMAVAIAPLGVRRVLAYANPLTRPLGNAFPRLPNLETVGPDGAIGSPADVAQGDDVFAVHWILEYQTGDTLRIGPHELTAPRANRFIPSWNPANNQLRLAESFKRTFLASANEFSHLFVSGFHILSDAYPDGSTALDCIGPVAGYLREVKSVAPGLLMHCELASIAGVTVRRGVREVILPAMDSVGLNEVELAGWLADLDRADLAERMTSEGSAPAALEGVVALAEATGINRVHLHNLGYYLAVLGEGDGASVRQGLLTGAAAAAVRAATGRPAKAEELTETAHLPIREASLSAMESVAAVLDEAKDFASEGVGRYKGRLVVMAPTRIVDRPVRTVGLGDTISTSSWLAEA